MITLSVNCGTFTQEPTYEQFLTQERVLGNTVNALLPLLRPVSFRGRRYSIADVASSITYACSNSTSITAACTTLKGLPSRQYVQYLVSKIDISRIESSSVNRALQVRTRDLLRKHNALDISIDMTDVPYHGQPENEGDVRRGPAKSGTTHFFTYASAYVMLHGRRLTMDMKYVREGEPLLDVVKYLLSEVQKASIRVKRLFLDKGFFTAPIISHLKAERMPYIMAVFPRGGGNKGGMRRLTAKKRDGFVTDYTMTDSKTGCKCRFTLYAVAKYRKNRYRNRHGVQYMYFTAGHVRVSPCRIFDVYRKRFGIESSYRMMNKSRGRTSSKSPVLRLLYVLVSSDTE